MLKLDSEAWWIWCSPLNKMATHLKFVFDNGKRHGYAVDSCQRQTRQAVFDRMKVWGGMKEEDSVGKAIRQGAAQVCGA
ncbi:hypothetical protein NAC44_12560 [Allorhizobium sp. BGMRC 0089]|uniref:hypothetical protein n=1 Tax=Allorhizobium sonneratiae TaxID=2934936 RepID=UPI0020347589|nr:hypothetical protein [Allorhizobium sonneratiae]MCM2293156.1 hypothetical protein [Allorhizobium sonneratiae]